MELGRGGVRIMIYFMKFMLAVVIALMGTSAFAHHSFEAEYDDKKPITLSGTVAKVDWMNPHIFIHIDAKDEAGKVTRWACEGGNPNSLIRAGWKRTSLKAGDEIVIKGYRAKDGSNTCNGRSVQFPDGRKLFAGSSSDGGPQQ
jgi:hypothetical protein